MHGLAHCCWQVTPTGAYAFFYSRIRSLKITDVADYDFNWGNVRGQTILDARGEEMRINTKSPPPARKVAPHLRKRFKDTREGQRLLGEKVFTSSGTDANGNYIGTRGRIADALRHILRHSVSRGSDLGPTEEHLGCSLCSRGLGHKQHNTNAHATAGGDISDDEGEPMDQ